MNQYIKLLAAVLALVTSALPTAQELHTFSNGDLADAEKINENFQYLLNNGGGCSAIQDGSSVVITCADGSSGALASAGTVVVYPEGTIGATPVSSIKTGDVVVVDANDVILGRVYQTIKNGLYVLQQLEDDTLGSGSAFRGLVGIANIDSDKSVFVGSYANVRDWRLFFTELDCRGTILMRQAISMLRMPYTDKYYLVTGDSERFEQILVRSSIVATNYNSLTGQIQDEAPICDNAEEVVTAAYLPFEYRPAPEILNAAYPVRLKQLP